MDFYPEHNENQTPGMMLGIVVANNDDSHTGMVQVSYRTHDGKSNTTGWMRILSPFAGKNRGFFALPDPGDEVVIACLGGDPDSLCVIGSLWNKENTFPDGAVTKENTIKTLVTRSGSKLLFSDEDGKETITISTPKGMKITLGDEHDTITIHNKDVKNKLTINGESGTVTLAADKKLEITSGDIELSAKGNLTLKAQKITISSAKEFTAEGMTSEIKGKGSLKLISSGITEIKGSMVKLNG